MQEEQADGGKHVMQLNSPVQDVYAQGQLQDS
jgi:hypothetical protein